MLLLLSILMSNLMPFSVRFISLFFVCFDTYCLQFLFIISFVWFRCWWVWWCSLFVVGLRDLNGIWAELGQYWTVLGWFGLCRWLLGLQLVTGTQKSRLQVERQATIHRHQTNSKQFNIDSILLTSHRNSSIYWSKPQNPLQKSLRFLKKYCNWHFPFSIIIQILK